MIHAGLGMPINLPASKIRQQSRRFMNNDRCSLGEHETESAYNGHHGKCNDEGCQPVKGDQVTRNRPCANIHRPELPATQRRAAYDR